MGCLTPSHSDNAVTCHPDNTMTVLSILLSSRHLLVTEYGSGAYLTLYHWHTAAVLHELLKISRGTRQKKILQLQVPPAKLERFLPHAGVNLAVLSESLATARRSEHGGLSSCKKRCQP